MEDVFVYQSGPLDTVFKAEFAFQQQDSESGQRFLVLQQGQRWRGDVQRLDWERLDFKEYMVRLELPDLRQGPLKVEALQTEDLLAGGNREQAQLHWRISLALMVPIGALLAMAMGPVAPRSGRWTKFLPGVLLFIVYFGLVNYVHSQMIDGKLPLLWGIWPVHLFIFCVAQGSELAKPPSRSGMKLAWYFQTRVAGATLVAMVILLGLTFTFEVIDEVGNAGRDYGFKEALVYALFNVPEALVRDLPLMGLIGALMGLGSLASSSELIAARAAGWSLGRIVFLSCIPGFVLGLIGLALSQVVVPFTSVTAENYKSIKQGRGELNQSVRGLWHRLPSGYVNLGSVNSRVRPQYSLV